MSLVLQGIGMIASQLCCAFLCAAIQDSPLSGPMTFSGVALQIKHARELHKDHQEVLPKDTTDRELLKKAGRYQVFFVCIVILRLIVAACCGRCTVMLRLACMAMLMCTMSF